MTKRFVRNIHTSEVLEYLDCFVDGGVYFDVRGADGKVFTVSEQGGWRVVVKR